jgi:hypothetical protein
MTNPSNNAPTPISIAETLICHNPAAIIPMDATVVSR